MFVLTAHCQERKCVLIYCRYARKHVVKILYESVVVEPMIDQRGCRDATAGTARSCHDLVAPFNASCESGGEGSGGILV